MQSNTTLQSDDEFITRTELLKIVGLTKSHQARLEKRGEFPQRVKLGKRCVGWSLSEVRQWMDLRKRERK